MCIRDRVYHVPFGAGYFENLPGYQYTQSLNAEAPYAPRDRATADDVLTELYTFKDNNVAPGPNAWDGIIASRKAYLDFLPQAKPQANEPIATTANELAAIAVKDGDVYKRQQFIRSFLNLSGDFIFHKF